MSSQLITALSTLGGAVIGFLGAVISNILSNRHTTKLEKLKFEEEKLKDKSKKNTETIEEVYQTLIKIEDLCVAFAYDVRQLVRSDLDTVGRIKEIRTGLQRVKTLIWLYLPEPIVIDFNEHMKIIDKFWDAAGTFYAQRGKGGISGMDILFRLEDKLSEAQAAYEESLSQLQGKLEKLVE